MTAVTVAPARVTGDKITRDRSNVPRAGLRDLIEGADAIAIELGFVTADTPRGQVIKARRKVYRMAEQGGWPIWRDAATGSICSSRQRLADYIDAQAAAAIARGTA